MGNCQAIDTATLVIQYPSGKSEKLFWPVSAGEIMKTNPGHYVALLISTTLCPQKPAIDGVEADLRPKDRIPDANLTNNLKTGADNSSSVRLTRIKLLRPTDTLVLGQVYRLITTQEVMKGLWAKKQAKQKRSQSSEGGIRVEIAGSELDKNSKAIKHERHRARTAMATPSTSSVNASTAAKSRMWQPSLNSISEASS